MIDDEVHEPSRNLRIRCFVFCIMVFINEVG